MSKITNTVESTENAPVIQKEPTNKEIYEMQKERKLYYKAQMESIEPQVKLMEQRFLLAKFTFDHYQLSVRLDQIKHQQEEEQFTQETKANEALTPTTTEEAPVVSMTESPLTDIQTNDIYEGGGND